MLPRDRIALRRGKRESGYGAGLSRLARRGFLFSLFLGPNPRSPSLSPGHGCSFLSSSGLQNSSSLYTIYLARSMLEVKFWPIVGLLSCDRAGQSLWSTLDSTQRWLRAAVRLLCLRWMSSSSVSGLRSLPTSSSSASSPFPFASPPRITNDALTDSRARSLALSLSLWRSLGALGYSGAIVEEAGQGQGAIGGGGGDECDVRERRRRSSRRWRQRNSAPYPGGRDRCGGGTSSSYWRDRVDWPSSSLDDDDDDADGRVTLARGQPARRL